MTSVGRLIEVRDQVRTYWVQSLWVVIVLLIDVNCWLVMWEVRSAKSWKIVSFLLLVGLVASIYLVTVLLFPRVPESGGERSTSTLIIIRTAASFS
jgi:cytochrome bd-type quinol oxidase subunit 2